jgi:hypothetical protein
MPASTLKALLIPVWMGGRPMTPAHRALEATNDKSEHIADGFSYKTTLSQGGFEWQEQRLVVRSF